MTQIDAANPSRLRYLKILWMFWSSSMQGELEYRLNFLMSALTAICNFAGSMYTLYMMFGTTGTTIHGWSWHQALIITGMFTMMDGVSGVLLSPNLSKIVQYVQKGTLDFILLKPINSQFWLSLRNASPWGIPSLIFGVTLTIYAAIKSGVSPAGMLLGVLPLLFGMVMLYSLWFVIGATTIWFTKIYNATEVLRAVTDSSKYPMSYYPAAFRFVFYFVLPVAFLTTVPAEMMLGKSPYFWIAIEAGLATLLFFAASWFWRFALRSYTSASS
jgi:ABC-2 type transport system permease protein